jgi:hypothetical protein
MKAYLMFKNKDFEILKQYPYGKAALIADLEIKYILEDMAREDDMIYEAAKEALLTPLISIEDIEYRQEVLTDVLNNPTAARRLYEITLEAERETKKSSRWSSRRYLPSVFSTAVELLDIYMDRLLDLRLVADSNLDKFQSRAFKNLLVLLQNELGDDYIETAKNQLKDLKKSDGTLVSSSTGNYLQGIRYVLREKERKGFWRRWLFAPSYKLEPRDNHGAEDMGERRNRAINEATNVLAQAAEHLQSFFTMLRQEVAFYVGCLNLSETIKEYGMPYSLPNMLTMDTYDRSWQKLYDISLLLTKKTQVIGNEMDTKEKRLYLITGANQGGKTTFLRSVGQAQLMAQCGMFVCADEFTIPIRNGIFTHFKREEDTTLTSGKLDEELIRMTEIVDHLNKNSLVLSNESFASTNEHEGSEINKQITKALIENQVEVFSVTHLYAYASSFNDEKTVHYLRAERLDDHTRTFKIVKGEPLVTAYGKDLYDQIFDD